MRVKTLVLRPAVALLMLCVSLPAAQAQTSANAAIKMNTTSTRVTEASRLGTKVRYASPAYNKAFAYNYMSTKYGWHEKQYSCLKTLWNHESGWKVTAHNSSGAHGIPQSLPGNKMAKFGSDWRTNPAVQIKWGLSYIHGRYGTPCSALHFWNNHRWY